MNNIKHLLFVYAGCGIIGGAGYGMTVWAKNPMIFTAHFGWLWVVFYALLGLPVGLICGLGFWTICRLLPKKVAPIVQYDAPQEGVWPPPPIVPGDSEKRNNT